MNESTNLTKTTQQQQQQQQHKPVILDTTSNKILGQNKIFKQPTNLGLKKATTTATSNAEYTFVVDKNNPQRNDVTLPSSSLAQPSAQQKADWTILPTPTNAYAELELDSTMLLVENFLFLFLYYSCIENTISYRLSFMVIFIDNPF